MRGLRGFTIVLAISLGQALAFGAPPEPSAPPGKTQEKAPEKQVTAVEYIKAGAYLYNKGQVDKASKYFQAADRFRNQLSDNEEIVLEVYLEEVENFYKKRPAKPRRDAAVAPAATTAAKPDAARVAEPVVPSPAELEGFRQPSRYDSTDPKQRARWLLQESREQMALGKYDVAARKIAEAEAMDVKWGFLEETPAKTAKLLQKVKAKSPNGPAVPSARPLGIRPADANPPGDEANGKR